MADRTLTFGLDAPTAERLEQLAAELGLPLDEVLRRAARRAVEEHDLLAEPRRLAAVALRLYQGKRLNPEQRRLAERLQLRALLARVQAGGGPVTLERLEAALTARRSPGGFLGAEPGEPS